LQPSADSWQESRPSRSNACYNHSLVFCTLQMQPQLLAQGKRKMTRHVCNEGSASQNAEHLLLNSQAFYNTFPLTRADT